MLGWFSSSNGKGLTELVSITGYGTQSVCVGAYWSYLLATFFATTEVPSPDHYSVCLGTILSPWRWRQHSSKIQPSAFLPAWKPKWLSSDVLL